MAAYGSGAVARSIRDECAVMNVDVGGGTSKIAVCADGKVTDLAALDVGARLLCLAPDGKILRVEEAGRRFAAELGIDVDGRRHADARSGPRHRQPDGGPAVRGDGRRRAQGARREPAAHRSARPSRHDRRSSRSPAASPNSSTATRARNSATSARCSPRKSAPASRHSARRLEPSIEGIRATVVGASQYTIQLSGSTIYVSPLDALPLRNVPVIAPALPLDGETIDPAAVAARDHRPCSSGSTLPAASTPVALFVPWRGSATFQRLDAFCRGVVEGLRDVLARGHPLILAGDGDVGGLIGIHLREEMKIANPIVSIDGLELKEFDYIDIGAMLDASGAVPVVIKSLIFPGSGAPRGQAAAVTSVTNSSKPAAAIAPPAARISSGRRASSPIAMPMACSASVAATKPNRKAAASRRREFRDHGVAVEHREHADQRHAHRERGLQRKRDRSAKHHHRCDMPVRPRQRHAVHADARRPPSSREHRGQQPDRLPPSCEAQSPTATIASR